ncbi:hypothetical protein ACFYNW_31710 [Streptomyces virginiae]|uniref:hypothetical protein n=1 Tax=Streptomyces virginiae TaxID=1961 RepID=UPI0036F179E3
MLTSVFALLVSGLGIPLAEAADKPPEVWAPPQTPLPGVKAVKGADAKPSREQESPGRKWTPESNKKMPAGAETVVLAGEGAARAASEGESIQAGKLPVWIASANGAKPPFSDSGIRSLKVEVKDAAKTKAAGVNGAMIALTNPVGAAATDKVGVGLDISSWAKNAGANWAGRARLVQLPSCALTTPGAEGCTARTPVQFRRDASGRMIAEVGVRSGGSAHASVLTPQSGPKSAAVPHMLAPQDVVLGVEPGPSSDLGDYSATPLLPSASWQAGANAGNFTYGYTAEIPSAIAGAAPSLVLGYDSSSIDGRTASTNAQAGLIGEGWDWHPGSISRSYKGCKDAGIKDSGDECWAGDILSLSMAGHAGQIVRDDTTCEYRLQGDDGTKIERLTDQRNSAWKGEAFKVTTTDGTQYYFGSNRLPGGDGTDPQADSVSTVPVYFNSGQDKCLGAATPANGTWQQLG